MKEIEKIWIEIGYKAFAMDGPNGIKIERISKEVGKNKSSFYHLFADLEIFTSQLLSYHIEQSKIVTGKEAKCTGLDDLIEVLVEHKIDLLFNRQLRINRENSEFKNCFQTVNEMTISAIIPLWNKLLSIEENLPLNELVLKISLENFFLQITDETINKEWLQEYFKGLKNLVSKVY
ncbi:TetR/AcrR family transcriptional regulator [Algoriphagus zhangzhouensis]|uniref:Transcriptional regulator, TetR family n=1 Tax=Algoriphagus zhangzhouensis TaxID=1073327 RepID=A0A1M7ZJ39_9BACT|nr:TetR/AcrR family transcriptional regulator [Algoriphagus zhangzhouensis]TDY43618.1 hypothetical protein A8938_3717 [Algoriphagus zhangzhouensis]SHO64921.1 transcriptional regulator, TetR family [Algoriphagus zhangzhouensis]